MIYTLLGWRESWNQERDSEKWEKKSENELSTFGTENHSKRKIKEIKQYQKNLKERSGMRRKKKKQEKQLTVGYKAFQHWSQVNLAYLSSLQHTQLCNLGTFC